jgi:tetratricopeptide (TPR) repeat protein
MLRLRSALLAALFLLLLPATALAVGQGRLQANVVDENGEPMPDVKIHISNEEIGYTKDISTNKKGRFNLAIIDATRVYKFEFTTADGKTTWSEDVKITPGGVDRQTFTKPSAAGPSAEEVARIEGRNKAVDAFNQGVALVQQGDVEQAKARFMEASRIDEDMPQPYSALAGIYLEEGDNAQAIAMANKFLELEPDNPRALQILYDAYQASGDAAKAEEMLNRLSSLEGGGTDAAVRVFNQGAEAARVGDLDGALEAFQKAAELDPELAPAYAALARVHFDREEYPQVIETAEKALNIDPDLTDLQKLRYEAYRRTGQEEKAKEVFAEMAQDDPEGLAQTLYEQGQRAFTAGNTAQAKTALEQALQANPNHARAHYYLGLCFVNTGEKAQAKEHLEKFIELAPDDPEAATAKDMIQYLG